MTFTHQKSPDSSPDVADHLSAVGHVAWSESSTNGHVPFNNRTAWWAGGLSAKEDRAASSVAVLHAMSLVSSDGSQSNNLRLKEIRIQHKLFGRTSAPQTLTTN
jgi:hypothetical protein